MQAEKPVKPISFRKCPCCSMTWVSKEGWEKDTIFDHTVNRDHVFVIRKGKDSERTIVKMQLEVRKHHCGGQMYDEGLVTSEHTERYSKPATEEVNHE